VLAALAACGGGGGGGSGADPSAGGLASTPQGANASAGSAPLAAQLQPGDFTLNGTTAGDQGRAAAVALPGGGFVAVWSTNVAGTGDVRMQRFGADGRPLGDEVVVAALGNSPGVTVLAGGGFLVSWSASPYMYEANGYGQRFDANGAPVGGTVQLAATFFKYVARPLGLADGGFALAVDTIAGRYGAEFGQVARYAADGTAMGTPVRLASELTPQTGALDPNWAGSTAPARWADGRFAVAWIASGTGVAEVRLSRFDAQANLVGTEVIAQDTQLQQPALAVLAGGQSALSWVSGADGSKTLWLEVFGPDGASLGRQAVASGITASSVTPRVAALGDGGLALGWRTDRYDTTTLHRTVNVQRFGAGGQPAGAAEQLAASSVPAEANMYAMDSLELVGGAGSSFLLLHGAWSAETGWDVRASAR
jgi:hypothetical protein